VNEIPIWDYEIISVDFSKLSNMLLVVSCNKAEGSNARSSIAVWDFLDGRKDFFCKSVVPWKVIDAKWNPYIKTPSDEFMSISATEYHYWRITTDLQM